MTETITTPFDNEYPFDVLENMMDDELREELNGEIAPCTAQQFADAYAERHEAKFSEEWEPYKANPQM